MSNWAGALRALGWELERSRQVVNGEQGLGEGGPIYGQKLAEMVKKYSSEAFYAFDDPLEAAVFSVMLR